MIEKEIKEKGYSLGFCQVGFTSSEPFNDYKCHLEKLIKEDKYPPFVTKDLKKRTDPKDIMEDCESIISVAMSYKENMKVAIANPPKKDEGYISPSAWGIDYHIQVKEAINELISFIDEKTEKRFQFKGFVDTGDLSDRVIAKRSGIGYVGKNSSLITSCSGSFVWLGHILTNLYLKPDEERENVCGDCTVCIKSCPTGAITDDGIILYDRCLANVLIQKEELSAGIIKKMARRIYGCDTCQVVCPKNQKVLSNTVSTKKELGWLALDELERLSNREFKRKYGKSAFSWRGKQLLLRNAKAIKDLKHN